MRCSVGTLAAALGCVAAVGAFHTPYRPEQSRHYDVTQTDTFKPITEKVRALTSASLRGRGSRRACRCGASGSVPQRHCAVVCSCARVWWQLLVVTQCAGAAGVRPALCRRLAPARLQRRRPSLGECRGAERRRAAAPAETRVASAVAGGVGGPCPAAGSGAQAAAVLSSLSAREPIAAGVKCGRHVHPARGGHTFLGDPAELCACAALQPRSEVVLYGALASAAERRQ